MNERTISEAEPQFPQMILNRLSEAAYDTAADVAAAICDPGLRHEMKEAAVRLEQFCRNPRSSGEDAGDLLEFLHILLDILEVFGGLAGRRGENQSIAGSAFLYLSGMAESVYLLLYHETGASDDREYAKDINTEALKCFSKFRKTKDKISNTFFEGVLVREIKLAK